MDWSSILVACLVLIAGWYLTVKSVGYLLLIWFDDAKFFVEYGTLFGFRKMFPHFDKFLKGKEQGSSITYLDYIAQFKDGFFTRLITCPKCLSVWLTGITLLFFILTYAILIDAIAFKFLILLPILAFGSANESLKEYKELQRKYE